MMPFISLRCFSSITQVRLVACLVVVMLALSVSLPPAYGADERQTNIKTGDKCERKTDAIPGVVKQDGCGRWYCGRADVKDITELVPNIEEVAHCKWQLQGSRCLCVKSGTQQ
jgi:hypothetical protein